MQKSNEFGYEYPPRLPQQAIDLIKGKSATKELNSKFSKELYARRNVQLSNLSNFMFLAERLEHTHEEDVRGVLSGYAFKPGFFVKDNIYKCYINKHLELMFPEDEL